MLISYLGYFQVLDQCNSSRYHKVLSQAALLESHYPSSYINQPSLRCFLVFCVLTTTFLYYSQSNQVMTAAKISAGSVGALRDLQPTFHLELPTLLQTIVVTSIEKNHLLHSSGKIFHSQAVFYYLWLLKIQPATDFSHNTL